MTQPAALQTLTTVKEPLFCTCRELRMTGDNGQEITLPLPDYPGARHDCSYTRRRARLIVQAEIRANLTVPEALAPDATAVTLSKWDACFTYEMARLAKPLLQTTSN
jgi:hypothetical protein